MDSIRGERGQGTVEAAFVIPVLFIMMLMLVQPGIVLYDYIVMNGAAGEACRLLATTGGEDGAKGCEDFVRNRLSAVPEHDLFHVHKGGCSWVIETQGDESTGAVSVSIRNEVRPLPLLGSALSLLGVTNGAGNLEIGVERASDEQPAWVWSSAAGSPSEWVGAWRS